MIEPCSDLIVVVEHRPYPRPVAVVSVWGDVDMVTVPRLERAVTDQLPSSPPAMIIDLSQTSLLAAAGLRVLSEAAEAGAQQHVALRLVVTTRAVRRPLEITGMQHLIPVHSNTRSALSSIPAITRLNRRQTQSTGQL